MVLTKDCLLSQETQQIAMRKSNFKRGQLVLSKRDMQMHIAARIQNRDSRLTAADSARREKGRRRSIVHRAGLLPTRLTTKLGWT